MRSQGQSTAWQHGAMTAIRPPTPPHDATIPTPTLYAGDITGNRLIPQRFVGLTSHDPMPFHGSPGETRNLCP